MYDEDKIEIDESRRLAQHEAVKGQIRGELHNEIARNASYNDPAERAQVESVAGDLKERAMHEVASTEYELDRARKFARISQIVDYIFCLIYGIIGLEVILELLGARESNAFKNFLDTLAAPLVAPFRGLVPDPAHGQFQLMLSYIVAIVIYFLLHLAVNGLLRMFVHKKTSV